MDSPEIVFDEQLAAAGAAAEVCANMSAFTNFELHRAKQLAEQAGISQDDSRVRGLDALLELWDEKIIPSFNLAAERDPTGQRGEQVTRPWRDSKYATA